MLHFMSTIITNMLPFVKLGNYEVTMLLTHLGHSPGDLDLVLFLR